MSSSSAQELLPQNLDLGNTFGILFIGVVVAALLFGVTNVQIFIYFQTDRRKAMSLYTLAVILLWILDALHLAFITHLVYYYLVINYADPSALTDIVWSYKLQSIMDFLIIYVVHVLYAYRIWIVSKGRSRTIPAVVGISVVTSSGIAIAAIWAIYQSHTFADLIEKYWPTYMALGTTAVNDLVIALSLCYLLATSRTGFSSTDSFLTKLMACIINTGCLTSVTSITAIITYAVLPDSLIPSGIQFIMVKLYVTSFLALMNARYYLQPNHSDPPQIRPPVGHIGESDTGELQFPMDVFQHSCGYDDEFYPAPPNQRPTVTKDNSFTSVTTTRGKTQLC